MSRLKRKLEGEIEITEAAGDVYHEMFKNTPHHFSHVSPHFIQSCDLHEGEHGIPGSIVVWSYKIGGKLHSIKCVMEEIDDEKKIMKQRIIEGDVMKEYKSFDVLCQVISKGSENMSIVRWTLEYEKKHPGIAEPSDLLDAILNAAKHLEDHHNRKN